MAFMKRCSPFAIRSHVLSAGGIASTDAIKTISSFLSPEMVFSSARAQQSETMIMLFLHG